METSRPGRNFRNSARTAIGFCLLTSAGAALAEVSKPNRQEIGDQQQIRLTQAQMAEINRPSERQKLSVSKEDANMMRTMAKSNIAKIQLAGLAQAISGNQIVQGYAQRLLDDHSRALHELKKLAAAQDVVIPGGPDEEDVAVTRKLALLKGNDFDTNFFNHAGTAAHEKSLQLYQDASERAENAGLQAFAMKNARTIRQHLKLAEEARQAYVLRANTAQ